jgi:hypothetical protein
VLRDSDSEVAAVVEIGGGASAVRALVRGSGGVATMLGGRLAPTVATASDVEVRVGGLWGLHHRWL